MATLGYSVPYSTLFMQPGSDKVIGLMRREAGTTTYNVYLGDGLKDQPDFSNIPTSKLAEQLILAGSYDEALEIYNLAVTVK